MTRETAELSVLSLTRYGAPLSDMLNRICKRTGSEAVLVGARPQRGDGLITEVRPRSPATEAAEIRRVDVGIVPLTDDPRSRGKCALKIIQYMSCAVPTVSSAVGANIDVVRHGEIGFLAGTIEEWELNLQRLSDSPVLRRAMALAGHTSAKSEYSYSAVAPHLADPLSRASVAAGSKSRPAA